MTDIFYILSKTEPDYTFTEKPPNTCQLKQSSLNDLKIQSQNPQQDFPQSFAPETHKLTGNFIPIQLRCCVSFTQTQAIIIIHHFTLSKVMLNLNEN